MFHCNAYWETLDIMWVKRAAFDGKNMGQYFHARWWQWSFWSLKAPKTWEQDESLILSLNGRRRFRVMLPSSTIFYHCGNGNSGWVDLVPNRKWSSQVWINCLENFRECFTLGVNWYATLLVVMNYLRRLKHSLLRRWSCGCRTHFCVNEKRCFYVVYSWCLVLDGIEIAQMKFLSKS